MLDPVKTFSSPRPYAEFGRYVSYRVGARPAKIQKIGALGPATVVWRRGRLQKHPSTSFCAISLTRKQTMQTSTREHSG